MAVGANWTAAQLSGRSQTVYDSAGLGLPERLSVWQDEETVATTLQAFDPITGNVLRIKKPQQFNDDGVATSQSKTITSFDAAKLYPATITNELGHLIEMSHDVYSGLPTRVAGPAQGPGVPEVITVYDGLGRATSISRSVDNGTGGYALEEVTRTIFTDFDPTTAAPETSLVEQKIDYQADTWVRRQSTFDGLGRPLAESALITPTPATSFYEYDPAGNLVTFSTPSPADDAAVATYGYCHDTMGRITQARQPENGEWQFEFNGKTTTRRQVVTDVSAPMEVTLTRDAFDRLRSVTEQTSTAPATWEYGFDANDNMDLIVDADGITTEMHHDFGGHRTRIDRGGRVWLYGYDLNGNMVSEETPNPGGIQTVNFISTWTYDALDRVLTHTPAPRDLSPSDLARFYGPSGRTALYQYDQPGHGSGIGRLTSVSLPISQTAAIPAISVDYTAEGWVKRDLRRFTIRPNGQPLSDTREYRIAYNGLGQPASVQHADRASVGATNSIKLATTYDERGLPAELVQVTPTPAVGTALLAHVDRNLAGVPALRSSAYEQGQKWTYDSLGRVTNQIIRSCLNPNGVPLATSRSCASGTTTGSLVRAGEELAYYDSGNLESLRDPINNTRTAYTYDEQHQLESATLIEQQTGSTTYEADFTYSPAGQLDTARVTSSNTSAEVRPRYVKYHYERDPATQPEDADPAAVRRLTTVDPITNLDTGVLAAQLDYDASGNLTHRFYENAVLDETRSFKYDGDNQLREAVLPDGSGEVYFYDHTGQRILAYQVGAGGLVPTLRHWFGSTEIEYNVAGSTLTQTRVLVFAALGAMPVARLWRTANALNRELLYSGVLGSLLAVVSTGGSLRTRYGYGPFGEQLYDGPNETNAADYHRLYEGKEHDELTSLSYFGFRYYDRLTLTWTQADPMYRYAPDGAWDEPRRASLYTYTLNNPLRYLDPDGRDPCEGASTCAPGAEYDEQVAKRQRAEEEEARARENADPDAAAAAEIFDKLQNAGRELAVWAAKTGVEDAKEHPVRAGIETAAGGFFGKGLKLLDKGYDLVKGGWSAFKAAKQIRSIAKVFASSPAREKVLRRVITSDGGIKTSKTVARQLGAGGPRNHIPTESILDTVGSGVRVADPQGVAGQFLYRSDATFNGAEGTLEVLVHEASGQVRHVLFRSGN